MIQHHGATDVGRRRTHNEDVIHARDGLFMVCDGMGGHRAGEVASRLAADAIVEFVERSAADPDMTWPHEYDPRLSFDANRLITAIRLANLEVFRASMATEDYRGMGTTVAAVLVHPRLPRMTYAHVGDSRIYLVRGGRLHQLTRDDTWNHVVGADGGPADAASMRKVLTKAVGVREDLDLEIVDTELEAGDIVLLCSDGLTDMVPDEGILEVIAAREKDVQKACEELVWRANAAGGRDNVSVLVLRWA